MQTEQRLQLTAEGQVNPAGEFEVLAITAGEGNGWQFPAACLQASLPLWESVETFVDHAWLGRSVRDLAGVCRRPEWDVEAQGVRLRLSPLGPSAPLLTALARQVLAEGDDRPAVGFSADLVFTASGQEVQEILKVYSVDLVMDPARGGAFVRALNALYSDPKEVPLMSVDTNPRAAQAAGETAPAAQLQEQIAQDHHAVRSLLDEQTRLTQLAQEAEQARQVRGEMCRYLLDTALAASRLPSAMQEHVRSRFAGQVFEAAELQTAIEEARSLVSELTAASLVTGPGGHISQMFSSGDRLQAAVDDLFGAPRTADQAGLKAAKLSGIRELYLMLTGDHELHGGFFPERVQFATTTDFSGLVKNAMNKVVLDQWQKLGQAGYDWWTRVAQVEHFNTLNAITGILVGTVGALPSVAEGAAYTELAVGDSPETASFVKYGGYIPLTLELIDRDETHKLRAYPRELASAGLRKISALAAAVFTANSGIGPTLADTGALFNATAVTTAGGHANLGTTALSAAAWDTACTAVYNQPMLVKNASGSYGTGPMMAINPRYLLVPRALQLSGMKILYPTLENAANIYSENMQRGAPGDVVTVPDWTDANDWAAVCDPTVAPALFVGERFGIMPEIILQGDDRLGAVFTNDQHRLKVRHFLAVWVNDFRPLYKSNVA